MTAGAIWRRGDGLRWVEIQTRPVEASGWRLMVPLLGPTDATHAPPLVIDIDRWRARTHLVTAAPADTLGDRDGQLDAHDLATVRHAVQALVTDA